MDARDIERLGEQTEANAWINIIDGISADFIAEYGLGYQRFGGAVALRCTGIDTLLFNRVIGLGVEESADETLLDAINASYAGMRFGFQLCPTAQTEPTLGWLSTHGFPGTGDWVKVYRATAPSDPVVTDLRVAEAAPEETSQWAETCLRCYEMSATLAPFMAVMVGRPGWHAYWAFDGDEPVATGALYVSESEYGRVGWLGAGATLPSHRKRGGQSAIMTRRIQDGLALGCQWSVTETGAETAESPNSSYHNMLRTGFTTAYLRRNFQMPKK